MLIFILLILASLITGFYITRFLNNELFLSEKLVYGTVIGLSSFVQIIYVFTRFYGLKPIYIILALSLIGLITAYSANKLYKDIELIKEEFRNSLQSVKKLENIFLPLIFVFWSVIFVILFSKNLFVKPDGIYSSTSTDMPVHMSFITSFVWGDNFPHQTPLYAGEKLVYPFLSDYFSAFLVSCGMNSIWAITFPGMLLCSLLTVIMYWFTYRLTENIPLAPFKGSKNIPITPFKGGLENHDDFIENHESELLENNQAGVADKQNTMPLNKKAALLSPFLLLLTGGFGFFQFFEKDLPAHSYNILETITGSYDLYTDLDKYNFNFFNFIIGYLLPQRSFIFGFPLAITAITLLWIAVKKQRKNDFLLAAITTGVIPLFHFHSFMNVVIIACFFYVLFFKKEKEYTVKWLYFFVPMTLLAIPQMLFVISRVTNSRSELFKFAPGWMAYNHNYLWFWLKNTGMFMFLVLDSLISKDTNKDLKKAYIPFVFLFIIANLISFSPCWLGDNAKVIYFWYIGSIPLIAISLTKLFRQHKAIAGIILTTLLLSGTLDITRFVFTPLRIYQIWTKDAVGIAKEIRAKTEPHAVFFNAPIHYSPLYLTGRATLEGDHIHVCTQGIDLYAREVLIKTVFSSTDRFLKMNLLKKLNADYALIGPPERQMLIDKTFFDDNFKVTAKYGEQTVFKLKK